MCGICGFNFLDEKLIRTMNQAIFHRGPDHGDVFLHPQVSLGNRRLSVIDLSESSNQPMSDPSGDVWLTYNGEIYNFKELRAQLEGKGYSFRSKGDAEVVLHAYRHWGSSFLERLNGMFALALFDKPRGKLLLARDAFGIKPLYYFWNQKQLIFASEIKAILEYPIARRVDEGALSEFFMFRFTLGASTMFDGIYKLQPGTCMIFDLGKGAIEKTETFWRPPIHESSKADLDELASELKELILDSVRLRLVSDVPLGFFLSGGIDSTIVLAAAKELGADVRAFSMGFETTNELPFARLAADRYADTYREIVAGDESLELLDDMVYHMDEPVGDAAFLAVLILSREAAREVKVVLAGEGADELFGGYDRYKAFVYGNKLSRFVPERAVRTISRWIDGENAGRALRIVGGADVLRRYLEVIRLFSSRELRSLGVAEPDGVLNGGVDENLFREDPLKAAQIFDLRTLLPNDFFMKADKMSSACSLELRVPFLDPRLVEFGLNLTARAKLRGWNEKALLKRAFADSLPRTIVKRRKHGFDVPMDHWLRGPLYRRLHLLLSDPQHDLYDPRPVVRLLERFREGSGTYKASFYDAQKLWSILVFELWFRRFMI